MSGCYAETCRFWTGDGCICDVMDIPEEEREVDPDERY